MFRSLLFNRIGLAAAALMAVIVLLAACGSPAVAPTAKPAQPTAAPTTAPAAAPTTAPSSAGTTTGAPDWMKLGFTNVLATQEIPAGGAADINAAPYQIKVPVSTFVDPVKLELLTADPSQFAAKAPQGEKPILAFALSITDAKTNQPMLEFPLPILMTVTDKSIVAQSKYYNLAPDGTFTENKTGLEVEAGLLTHPISGTGVAWVITAPGAAPVPGTGVLDWTQLGFPTVLASQDITPGTAASIKAGPFTIAVPAGAFSAPVKFEILTGDLARFLDMAPTADQPVLDFAFKVTDSQTNQLVEKFNSPVMLTADDLSITAQSMYYNIAPDGMYSPNPTGMQVKAGEMPHPIAGTGAGWVIATPNPTNVKGKIALLLPESKTTRYESADRPYFEAEMKKLCPNCEIIYNNANQDATLQLSQAEAALTNGAQVLVLDPVDSAAAAAIADKAKQQGVPVIAYDRLILNSNGVNDYISFDNMKVGELQAQSLVKRLQKLGKQNPTIVMINGAPTDNNAKLFKEGAHSIFDPLVKAGKLTIAKEYDTPDWSRDQAQNEMQQALTALGNKVDGVYAANDGTAGGAIAAMIAAGLKPLPPVTGQDAELAAIQRILTNQQYMTVYKAIKPEAQAAALMAFDLLAKVAVPPALTNGQTVNNNKIDVPSVLLTPLAVTVNNIKDTIVKDGFWTAAQICTTQYADACKAAGLSGF